VSGGRHDNEYEPAGSPTAARMLLGAYLRRLREDRGITLEDAGDTIRASHSKMSRMELGRVGFKPRDVLDLLGLYGVRDERELMAMLARVRDANAPGPWQPYSDILPDWFQRYLDLEAAASLIRTYEVQFVPGLLQTKEYARAVVRLGHGEAREEEIDLRVHVRLERQALLNRSKPPQLWAVVDEAALRRPLGGLRVMRDQIQALIEATELPNVKLQVIPLEAGGHSAVGGSFTILRFPHDDLPDIVYLEQLTNAQYLDKREDVDRYAETVGRLVVEAEPPTRTVEVLRQILRRLEADVRTG
jgi:transcriptional regulator with XRE-family HTH domain